MEDDVLKATKLAAARKRLKEFQDRQKLKSDDMQAIGTKTGTRESSISMNSFSAEKNVNGMEGSSPAYVRPLSAISMPHSICSNGDPSNKNADSWVIYSPQRAPNPEWGDTKNSNTESWVSDQFERKLSAISVTSSQQNTDFSNDAKSERFSNSLGKADVLLHHAKYEQLEEENKDLKNYVDALKSQRAKLGKQLFEANSQIAMLELKLQQLSTGLVHSNSGSNVSDQDEQAKLVISELEKRISEMEFENKELTEKYLQYSNVLKEKIMNAETQAMFLMEENQSLKENTYKQTQRIVTLESSLRGIAEEVAAAEVERLKLDNSALKANLREKEECYDSLRTYCTNLEVEVANLRKDAVDLNQLQLSLESNIVAASQAVSQNNELKEWMLKIEEALKMEKMRNGKLLQEVESAKLKLAEMEIGSGGGKSGIVVSDASTATSGAHPNSIEKGPRITDAMGMSDKMEDNTSARAELQQLKQDYTEVMRELSEERMKIGLFRDELNREATKNAEMVRELERERAKNTGLESGKPTNGKEAVNVEAMVQLQEQLKGFLDKTACLTEEKMHLEHLVTQLQSETETIGEYVHLYQRQRGLLQERAREMDAKLEDVAREKAHFKSILNLILSKLKPEELELMESDSSLREFMEEMAQTNDSVVQTNVPSCACCSGKLLDV